MNQGACAADLVTVFGGCPRDLRYASTISGTTSDAGFIREKSSSVSSGISTASQSSWLMWSGFRFFIFGDLSLVSFSKTDNSDYVISLGEDKNKQSFFNASKSSEASFSVLESEISLNLSRFPVESFRKGKINPMFGTVGLSFEFIPFVFHELVVHTKKNGIQVWVPPISSASLQQNTSPMPIWTFDNQTPVLRVFVQKSRLYSPTLL